MAPDEAQGLLQREVAELLGVSRPRVAQLVAAGHLRRNAAGKIDPAEVERCRRKEAIAWQHPPAPPPPAPAAAPAANRDDLRAGRRELHRLQALESRWLSSYTTFWEWVQEARYELELWRQLGDQPEIGDVMVEARRLLVARLAELNEVCAAAKFSR
jgi:transcriptional regulator with XRE-family HTH domain